MKWPDCDATELLNPDLCSTYTWSFLIKYYFSAPQGYLLILQVRSHSFILNSINTLAHTLEISTWPFIYTFQIVKLAQIQIKIINIHHHSQLESIHKVIKLHMSKQKKAFASRPYSVETNFRMIYYVSQ